MILMCAVVGCAPDESGRTGHNKAPTATPTPAKPKLNPEKVLREGMKLKDKLTDIVRMYEETILPTTYYPVKDMVRYDYEAKFFRRKIEELDRWARDFQRSIDVSDGEGIEQGIDEFVRLAKEAGDAMEKAAKAHQETQDYIDPQGARDRDAAKAAAGNDKKNGDE